MKPNLVPDWKQSWRWFSMQAQGASLALVAAWAIIPDDIRAAAPTWLLLSLLGVLLTLGMVGRLISQKPPKEKPDADDT